MLDYSFQVHLENMQSRELGTMLTSTVHSTAECNAFIYKIPLDGTTGTVYHPRATIELALTCAINNCNTTLNNHLSIHTNVKQTILLYC